MARIVSIVTVIWVILAPLGIMAWTYLQGQSGPWVVAVGMVVTGAAMWLRRELILAMENTAELRLEIRSQELALRVEQAEQELAIAQKFARTWEAACRRAQAELAQLQSQRGE
jgi:hypothetical protein